MTNKDLLDLVILEKKYSDCLSDLGKMQKNWDDNENMRFTEGQLLTAIFVLGRISKHLGKKIDKELFILAEK